jgi:two-component system, sensor histidine kinase
LASAQTRTAIVLEDDPNARAALVILLEDWGWTPVVAITADAVLQLVGSALGAVRAVVTDYNLGDGINGVDEVKRLQAAGLDADVLVMSGSMRGRAQEAAKQAGHDYLAKPVKPAALQAWLADRD